MQQASPPQDPGPGTRPILRSTIASQQVESTDPSSFYGCNMQTSAEEKTELQNSCAWFHIRVHNQWLLIWMGHQNHHWQTRWDNSPEYKYVLYMSKRITYEIWSRNRRQNGKPYSKQIPNSEGNRKIAIHIYKIQSVYPYFANGKVKSITRAKSHSVQI